MALLRVMLDAFLLIAFTSNGIYMYYQHHYYDYSTHPLTVIFCKIGAITMILLSISLFFSNFANNFLHIIHMKEVGEDRYLRQPENEEPRNNQDPNAAENEGNGLAGDAENEGNGLAGDAENEGNGLADDAENEGNDLADEAENEGNVPAGNNEENREI